MEGDALLTTSSLIAIAISALALLVSLATLWRSHLAPFRIVSSAGAMAMRIYHMEGAKGDKWQIVHFAVSVGVTNSGAAIGQVLGARAIVRYPSLPIDDAHETFTCIGEFDPVAYDKNLRSFFSMLRKAKLGNFTPFAVLPRATVTKFLIFSQRWDKPVRQRLLAVEVQVLTDRRDEWISIAKWEFHIGGAMWNEIESGSSYAVFSDSKLRTSETHPADLHKFTYDRELEDPDWQRAGPTHQITPGDADPSK